MAQDTAVSVLTEIIEDLGGTTNATTVVPALRDLQAQIGDGGLEQYVTEYLAENPNIITDAVIGYLAEHGAEVGYEVDENGDLTITIS